MATPMRPYLVRALIRWIEDNGLSPFVLVDTTLPGVEVPDSLKGKGQAVLSLAKNSLSDRSLENGSIVYRAAFPEAKDVRITVPMAAVLAVFADENGRGMAIPPEQAPDPPTPPVPERRSHLRVVK